MTAPARSKSGVLTERARQLARPLSTAASDLMDLLLFGLMNEVYGIEPRYVTAVFRLSDLTPLPGAEVPVTGVTTWRGGLLAMLDLRRVLGIAVASLTDQSTVVVLGDARPSFGILADDVRHVVSIPRAVVLQPAEGAARNREFVRGIAPDAVIVLDGEGLLRRYGDGF